MQKNIQIQYEKNVLFQAIHSSSLLKKDFPKLLRANELARILFKADAETTCMPIFSCTERHRCELFFPMQTPLEHGHGPFRPIAA